LVEACLSINVFSAGLQYMYQHCRKLLSSGSSNFEWYTGL